MLRWLATGLVGACMMALVEVGSPAAAPARRPLDPKVEALLRNLAGDCGFDANTLDELLELARDGALEVSEEQAAEMMSFWYDDIIRFWRECLNGEPDLWQARVLRAVIDNPRVAMKACKGPGKSTVLAVIVWWFLTTREHPNVICVSITGDNLRDGLWKELAKWYARAPLLQRMFEMNAERIVLRESPKTWWCSARQFAKQADLTQQANTLAGLHNTNILVVLDEVSDYPPGVLPAAEAIFATEGQDAHLVVAGNPTKQAGPLWDICTRFANRWWTISITGDPDDAHRAPRISKKWAQQLIDDWGRDSSIVKTNVLGEFPEVQSNKLIGPNDVVKAEKRVPNPDAFMQQPRVMGIDVARKGSARSICYMRQGHMVWSPEVWTGLRTDELTDRIAALIVKHDPDAVFVDNGTFGAAVVDSLRRLGFANVTGIDFAGKASKAQFLNKRAEMWWNMQHAVKDWVCLPPGGSQLQRDITEPEFEYREVQGRTLFVLEGKDELEERGVASPDEGDALALTFARTIPKRDRLGVSGVQEAMRQAQDFQPRVG